MDKETLLTALKTILAASPWNTRQNLETYVKKLESGEYLPKQRTYSQNRALHLFYRLLAETLNNSNLTVQLVLAKKMDLEWDEHKVKELLWRPAQQAILGKKSTTELSKTEDIDKVYDHLVRHLGEKFEIEVPEWPHDTDPAPML